MLKKTLIAFTLSFLSLLGNGWENYAAQPSQKTSDAPTGTLQKMIVESGSVTMDFDLNGLNGSSSLVARPVTLHLAAALTVKPTPEEQNGRDSAVRCPRLTRCTRLLGNARHRTSPSDWRTFGVSAAKCPK